MKAKKSAAKKAIDKYESKVNPVENAEEYLKTWNWKGGFGGHEVITVEKKNDNREVLAIGIVIGLAVAILGFHQVIMQLI